MGPVAACIPTKFGPPTLQPLLDQLDREGVGTYIWNDIAQPPHPDIYRWWQDMADEAIEDGHEFIAVLNDDIELPDGALPFMARALDKHREVGIVYPDMSVWRHFDPPPPIPKRISLGRREPNGMTGFCFMFRADLPVRFDLRYRWHWGDTQFAEDVEKSGLLVSQLNGLGIQHLHGYSHRFMDEGWMKGLIRDDTRRWQDRHPVVH